MSVELVSKLKLKADNQTEQRILDYLNQNASVWLAEKINAGKKTLSGAVQYATDEAKKLAKGGNCVCVDDATVFGWIIHFFEEDFIEEPKKKSGGKVPGGVKKQPKPAKPAKEHPPVEPEEPKIPPGPIILELFSVDEVKSVKKAVKR